MTCVCGMGIEPGDSLPWRHVTNPGVRHHYARPASVKAVLTRHGDTLSDDRAIAKWAAGRVKLADARYAISIGSPVMGSTPVPLPPDGTGMSSPSQAIRMDASRSSRWVAEPGE